jgi:hypothetical protein
LQQIARRKGGTQNHFAIRAARTTSSQAQALKLKLSS